MTHVTFTPSHPKRSEQPALSAPFAQNKTPASVNILQKRVKSIRCSCDPSPGFPNRIPDRSPSEPSLYWIKPPEAIDIEFSKKGTSCKVPSHAPPGTRTNVHHKKCRKGAVFRTPQLSVPMIVPRSGKPEISCINEKDHCAYLFCTIQGCHRHICIEVTNQKVYDNRDKCC